MHKIKDWIIDRLGGWTQQQVNERIDEIEQEIIEEIKEEEGLKTIEEWSEKAKFDRAATAMMFMDNDKHLT